jgi:hypothetical protein
LALAKHLGQDPRADRKKLNAILRAWYANGVLAAEIQRRGCATSGNTWFPEIGTMIPMPPDSTASVAMREVRLKLIQNKWLGDGHGFVSLPRACACVATVYRGLIVAESRGPLSASCPICCRYLC